MLRTEVNLLEDLLPPDVPLHDRVSLLEQHETAWATLQLNTTTRFVINEEPHSRYYDIQGGYLIYSGVTNMGRVRYGYMDLNSSPSLENAEKNWTHISLAAFCTHWDMVFAVDHNLVVAIRF